MYSKKENNKTKKFTDLSQFPFSNTLQVMIRKENKHVFDIYVELTQA